MHRTVQLIVASMLLGAPALGPATASAAPGEYGGLMTFPNITSPSGPEEFSWEVKLGKEQELVQLDEQHAAVYYVGTHHAAFGITAELAHDAEGANVPTSLGVTQPNIITLTVHHRAGNPAAEGAPFVYPIVAGSGWEGGFQTEIVSGPKDEQELREEREKLVREEAEAAEKMPPDTKIVKHLLKRRPPVFVFSFQSSKSPSTFRCKLDRRSFAACPSSLRFRHLKPGHHVLRVVAVDAAGCEDPTPAVTHFSVSRHLKHLHRKHSRHRVHRRHRDGRRHLRR